ncbi:MAG TPA: MFS transporter [Candidatus Limnocylindrales bacterium]|nr:MFS transporter [Candidatus Limnocylindrales bacterium]
MRADETSPAQNAIPARWRTGFWSLIATQFQGAFSDNALKWVVSYLILGMGLAREKRDLLFQVIVPLLFALPFLLFSMAGGFLADRFSKRSVTIGTKLMEISVMGLALAGLATGRLSWDVLAIFLIGTQAALFGPSKYGLLPEVLPERELSWGNGILELGTFVAIITGTMAAGALAEAFRGRQEWSGVIFIGLALAGLITSLKITRVAPANPQKKFRWNPAGELWTEMRYARKDRVLWLALMGNLYFWFLGSLLLINIVLYATDVLHVNDVRTSILMAAVTLGIGIGSVAAGYLSGNKIEYGLIPLGALGITVTAALLGTPRLTYVAVAVYLSILGFFAGFFAVPINALIQHRPAPERKGAMIAAANLISFVGIGLQPVAQLLLMKFGHPNPSRVFLLTAAMTAIATVYGMILLPDSLLRFLLWLATHSLYRIRVEGRENIPERGGALFVASHLSFVDALLLTASIDRPIRFLMERDICENQVVKPFARILKAIPIFSLEQPRESLPSLREATEAIRAGDVVCIFADGPNTSNGQAGQMLSFPRAFEGIIKGVEAPVLPVCLDGEGKGIVSFKGGRFAWKFPRRLFYPVTVSFGKPIAPAATPTDVSEAVRALQMGAYRSGVA